MTFETKVRGGVNALTITRDVYETQRMLLDLFGKYGKVYSHASFSVTRTLIYGVCAARKAGHNARHAQEAR